MPANDIATQPVTWKTLAAVITGLVFFGSLLAGVLGYTNTASQKFTAIDLVNQQQDKDLVAVKVRVDQQDGRYIEIIRKLDVVVEKIERLEKQTVTKP